MEGRRLRVSCSRERASSRLLSPGHVRATSGHANANTISFRGHSSIETTDFSLELVVSLESSSVRWSYYIIILNNELLHQRTHHKRRGIHQLIFLAYFDKQRCLLHRISRLLMILRRRYQVFNAIDWILLRIGDPHHYSA